MPVLLILGVIWAAVLVPPWLQHRREARPTESIRSFHRQLWLLERTSPSRAAAGAGRRRGGPSIGPVARHGVTVYGSYDDHYLDESHLDEGYLDDHYVDDGYLGDYDDPAYFDLGEYDDLPFVVDEPVAVSEDGAAGAAWVDADGVYRRPAAQRSLADGRSRALGYRRRRRVLLFLLLSATATAPPAILLGGTAWSIAQVVADALLVLYVVLLVRRQRLIVEREEKVHYLAPIRAPRPPVVVLHGRAAR